MHLKHLLALLLFVPGLLQAEAELFLAILPPRYETEQLFDPAEFARLLRVLGVYDIGVDANGARLEMPVRLLEAERQSVEAD